ncbi:MAG: HAD-IIIA family hydrolase [bacterium]
MANPLVNSPVHPLLMEPLQRPFRRALPHDGPRGRALFVDRDGVMNRLIIAGYVRTPEELELLPESLEALRIVATETDYKIVLFTNQSVVGRGDIPRRTLEAIHQRMLEAVEAAGGRFDLLQVCAHAPYMQCDCRKPRPGMLYEAAEVLHLDLTQCWTIGDSVRDIVAGKTAGTRVGFIRAQGWHDEKEWDRIQKEDHSVDFVAHDLLEAVRQVREYDSRGITAENLR